jgi:DNA-binding response OmpR family regulator
MALDILIIDDEDDIRDLIAGILEDEGFEARQAPRRPATPGRVPEPAP